MDLWNNLAAGSSPASAYTYKKDSPSNEMGSFYFLFLKFKGVLYATEFGRKRLINLQSLFHGITTMNHSRMVTIANELPDTRSRHLRIFLSQLH